MKIQEINSQNRKRYILIDNDYRPVKEVNKFLKYLDLTGKSPNTLKNYAYHLKSYYEYMSFVGIDVLELCDTISKGPVDILSGYMMYLQYPNTFRGITDIKGEENKIKNDTVNIKMNTVLAFYQYLAANNEINELEIYKQQRLNGQFKSFLSELVKNKTQLYKSVFRMRENRKEIKTITRYQFTQVFNKCYKTRDRLLVSLLFEGGLRVGEVLGLHISDINSIEDGIIKIIPRENNANGTRVKNNSNGIIKIPDYVVELILVYLDEDLMEFDSDYLFLNSQGKNKGEPMHVATVEKLFERLSNDVGFRVHPHMLRHGFATEKLEFGWSMEDISMYLRHKSLQSTQIYTHYSDELKKDKILTFLDKKKIEYGGIAIDDNK